ncbi:hypothetical protein PQG83_09725 [Candidatus Nitrospira neomarina]|uniref:Uncharacterized protein n=1 Tax=Candidatus Nitrospira neomarina TaxID=3020899 RepID=A0AA96GME7_9BACT|nr:hypothetical protein [Candidatus Nitrospira neomarina]WNM64012.1 hypothetical protein PQG83_09725 [Candidatus Nitrospira neomarina]
MAPCSTANTGVWSPALSDVRGPPALQADSVRARQRSGLLKGLEQWSYADTKRMLRELETWLRTKNESAADSLLEAFQELLTLHRLKVPALLYKTCISTNPIGSMLSPSGTPSGISSAHGKRSICLSEQNKSQGDTTPAPRRDILLPSKVSPPIRHNAFIQEVDHGRGTRRTHSTLDRKTASNPSVEY